MGIKFVFYLIIFTNVPFFDCSIETSKKIKNGLMSGSNSNSHLVAQSYTTLYSLYIFVFNFCKKDDE